MSKMTDSKEAWLYSFKSGKIWLQGMNSPKTKLIYVGSLRRYCDAVGKTPDELIELKMEGQKNIGTMKEFQAEELLEEYLNTAKLTDPLREQIKASIISFYKTNRRRLDSQTAKNIGKPTPKQRSPTIQDLEKLEGVMTTQRDKALVWFFASSGCRIGTVKLLKWQDLIETGDKEVPYKMVIEAARLKGHGLGRYSGLKQICFLHSLAARKLEEYKHEAKQKGYNLTPESPLFILYNCEGKTEPIKIHSTDKVFTVASLTLWHDLGKKRFSPQDIRDFTQSALESSGANSNVISPKLAHKVHGVDKFYSAHGQDELLEVFKHALPWLLPQNIEKVKAETESIRAKYEKLEDEFAIQLAEKQKETMKAVFAMLKAQGIKVTWEEEGEEP